MDDPSKVKFASLDAAREGIASRPDAHFPRNGEPTMRAGFYVGSRDGLAHRYGRGQWWSACGAVRVLDWSRRRPFDPATDRCCVACASLGAAR